VKAEQPPLVLATRSADKLREVRAILAGSAALRLVSLAELAIGETAEEDDLEAFDSFRENARAKAEYFARLTGATTLADDSGLMVDALGGAPGVRSKRFSDSTAAGADLDRANNAELLRRLAGVPPQRRTARYVCAAALATPDGMHFTGIGTCAGLILETPAGSGGFGYDPLFYVTELGATFGEVDAVEKHRRSHRGRAFRALAAVLPDLRL
jgi:XTP/dITP diphosphohydrolase